MTVPTVTTGQGPAWIAIDHAVQYAYVANITDHTISQYAISAAGPLAPLNVPTVPTGTQPFVIAITD
jgi:DNA-binding beta-propeller fold protein YncE